MTRAQRILLVEDDAELRRMLRLALTLDGFDVEEAGDGLDALHLIDNQPPDALILDLGLPRISGYTVRQELAAHAHTRHIPVIVVTGEPGDHAGLNVACVLRKPVRPERLVSVVRQCIASGGAFTPSS